MSYIGNSPITQAFLTDQFSGNGSTTTFTMTVAPATTSSILVSVTGVLQDPSTYSVSGTTLTFSAAPPTGTGNISVRYLGIPASGVTTTAYRTLTEFTATAGQTTFTPPSYTVGFLNVYRNGVLLGSADYTATNGTTVVLASGASAGDLVTTESFYVSSVLNALPNTGGTVSGNMAVVGTLTTTSGIGTNGANPAGTALIAGRVDSSSEGGQLDLCRSTDNTSAWAIDVYGNTSTPALRFIDNVAGAERMRINAGAPILCLAGGNTSATGTGIAFPATQSASTDANCLDDYEEGTWTPTIGFGGASSSGATYSAQTGYYTKIGNVVAVQCLCTWTAKGSSTGIFSIEGLPFTNVASNGYCGVSFSPTGLNYTGIPTAQSSSGTTSINFYQMTTAGVKSAISNTGINATGEIILNITYRVA